VHRLSYDEGTIKKVWEKGGIIPGYDPEAWRQDECGAWIGRRFYGNKDSQYGWEIFAAEPRVQGSEVETSNLHPMQWENSKARKLGRSKCVVTGAEARNIRFLV